MKKKVSKNIILFEKSEVRRTWHNKEWYFSVIDIIAILSGSDRPRKYWDDLKRKLKEEGSELSEKIGQLKLRASDGKLYLTDVSNFKGIFRIIQSIPSPKAEPFKQWLAKVGQGGFKSLKKDAKIGGKIAGNTRKQIENKTRQKVLRKENYLNNNQNRKLK